MPMFVDEALDIQLATEQVVLANTEDEYIDQIILALSHTSQATRPALLLQRLAQYSSDVETEIERICASRHQEFGTSVKQLLQTRESTVDTISAILELNSTFQTSTENLVSHKKALVDSRGDRRNVDESAQAINDSLNVLHLTNQVHGLLNKKAYYVALRALEELESVHLQDLHNQKLVEVLQLSIPSTKASIADAVMGDLNTWLFRVRETSQFIGEVAFYAMEQRRLRLSERLEQNAVLDAHNLSQPLECVLDELAEFDILDNDDVQVDFTPLFECMHIHLALGQLDTFRRKYADTRQQQKDLTMLASISMADEELAQLSELLESVAGFAIIEKATLTKVKGLRTPGEVSALWSSMCQSCVSIMKTALKDVSSPDLILKIKGVVSLFSQAMSFWDYDVVPLKEFLIVLFERYTELLRQRFSEDFNEIVSKDDYKPMEINSEEDYEKVLNVTWYQPKDQRIPTSFPHVLPFSQMYPLCCIDVRNFQNTIHFFDDEQSTYKNIIENSLSKCLDDLLVYNVCKPLLTRLESSSELPPIVQILVNIDHFEFACIQLESSLLGRQGSNHFHNSLALQATAVFHDARQTATSRIFALLQSKLDDLIESADYDWTSASRKTEASQYIQDFTRYLSDTVRTQLSAAPPHFKEQIYETALDHMTTRISTVVSSPEVKIMNENAISDLALDVRFLSEYVHSLGYNTLSMRLAPLQQLVVLLQAENPEEFYDRAIRERKYNHINAMTGPQLIEKISKSDPTKESTSIPRHEKLATFSKFGHR